MIFFTIGYITEFFLRCICRKIIFWSLITCSSLSDMSLSLFSDVFEVRFSWSLINCSSLSDSSPNLFLDVFLVRFYFLIFDHLFITIGYVTEFILRCIWMKIFLIFDQLFIIIGYITEFVFRCIFRKILFYLWLFAHHYRIYHWFLFSDVLLWWLFWLCYCKNKDYN